MPRMFASFALAVAMVACGGGRDEGTEPIEPTETATATRTTTALEGTWAIEEVTAEEALAALRERGFGRHELGIFLGEVGASEWFGLTLKFAGGDYTLFGSPDGAELAPWDYGSTFTVDGDILTLVYSTGGGTTTFRWTIVGDRLELELIEDTQPDYLGLPTDVWVAALFTSEPFVRAGS